MKSDQRFSRLSGLVQFGQVSQQFFLIGHAAEVPADHFVGPKRRLPTCPQADQHACDDRAVDLHFDAVLARKSEKKGSGLFDCVALVSC